MPKTDQEMVRSTLKRMNTLLGRKQQFLNHWEELAQVMLTRREGFTSTTVDGDYRNDDIYDGTPMQGARSLANTTGAMIRPEGDFFAKVALEDKTLESNDEAGAWLADTTERMEAAIKNPKARFRQSTGEVDLDLVVFGTGIISANLSKDRDSLIFQSTHLKDGTPFFNEEGHAVGMFKQRTFTVWEAVEKFGSDALHKDVRELVENEKWDDKIKFVQAVVPREQQRFKSPLLAVNMPWASMWIDCDREFLVKSEGFQEFPFIVPRWNTSSGETYGRSPGMVALPDANTLQAMGETILVAGQRSADPPLMVPDDGAFNELNTFPGGISYYSSESAAALNGRNPFFPLISGANLPISRDMQTDTRNQVMNAFFKNILNLPVGGPEMTATEIIQRKDEFIREVGPVFGIFESDYNMPLAERVFNIMLRANAFAPIPEALSGAKIKFQFELPVTKVRKQVQAAAARQWAVEQMELAAVDPDHVHIVNAEALARFSHDALGLPHDIITGREEFLEKVAASREARQKQQQELVEGQSAQTLATGAKGVKDLGGLEALGKQLTGQGGEEGEE